MTTALEFVHFTNVVEVTITNVGRRAITITGIWLRPKGLDPVPGNAMFSDRIEPTQPLPATINDGEHIMLTLSDDVSRVLLENGMETDLRIYDAEGRTYSKHKTSERNPKFDNIH